jgi:hypothetical protein
MDNLFAEENNCPINNVKGEVGGSCGGNRDQLGANDMQSVQGVGAQTVCSAGKGSRIRSKSRTNGRGTPK